MEKLFAVGYIGNDDKHREISILSPTLTAIDKYLTANGLKFKGIRELYPQITVIDSEGQEVELKILEKATL